MEAMEILEKQKFIFGILFFLANKCQSVGDQYLAEGDITTRQWLLTVAISRFGENPPTLSEVAEEMSTSHQNIKQLALKLQKKDFLTINKDEFDGRAIRLELTEKCNDFWEERQEQDNSFIGELFEGFKEEELDIICDGLSRLLNKVIEVGQKLKA